MENTDNLWPEFKPEKLKNPKTILKEQAALLGQKTSNMVLGEIESGTIDNSSIFHSFFVVAPSLNNYRFELFYVKAHPIFTYPFEVINYLDLDDKKVSNEGEFIEELKRLFSAEKTQKVISSLISQSME